jgi:hypothetical protein
MQPDARASFGCDKKKRHPSLLDACFIVSDNAGQKPAHVYFEEKLGLGP